MPDRNLETKWLEDFLTVCKTRSFSRAADERCVTQSALSRRIRALEEWVGLELIQRNAYPLTLTREGKQFQETAADLIERLSRARDRIAGGRPIEGGELAFAVVHTLSILFFPRWLFESDRPEAIKGMALAGHGVGWLPESLVTDELRYGHLSIAGGEEWTTACEIRLYRATQNRVPDAERVWHYATKPSRKTMG